MTTPINPAHAAEAIAAQDACNPCGVTLAAWHIACDVSHEYGTDAVNAYSPYRLMLGKLADLARMAYSISEYETDYLACVDARDNATSEVTRDNAES